MDSFPALRLKQTGSVELNSGYFETLLILNKGDQIMVTVHNKILSPDEGIGIRMFKELPHTYVPYL